MFDIPADVTELPTGAGTADTKIGTHSRNDYSIKAYGGAGPSARIPAPLSVRGARARRRLAGARPDTSAGVSPSTSPLNYASPELSRTCVRGLSVWSGEQPDRRAHGSAMIRLRTKFDLDVMEWWARDASCRPCD
ncbi:hypothetical protein [Nonomuraea dietziae]|uniref:hypothetical protein n=1 Tax=Nonomuraea dietziae TaxID=65515 RepID=UPI003CD055BD